MIYSTQTVCSLLTKGWRLRETRHSEVDTKKRIVINGLPFDPFVIESPNGDRSAAEVCHFVIFAMVEAGVLGHNLKLSLLEN